MTGIWGQRRSAAGARVWGALAMLLLTSLSARRAEATTVGPGQDFATLQEAVDAWTDGDVIEIHAGTYTSVDTAVVHIHDAVGMTLRAVEAGVVIDGEQQRVGICLRNTTGVVIDGGGYGITIRHGVNADLGHGYALRRGSGVVDQGSAKLTLRNLVLSANDSGADAYPACAGCDAGDGLVDVYLEGSAGVLVEEVDAASAANANLIGSGSDLVLRASRFRHGTWYPARVAGLRPLIERSYFQASSTGDGGAASGARVVNATQARIRYSVFDARGSGHAAAFELVGQNAGTIDAHTVQHNLFLAGASQVAAVRLTRALTGVTLQNNIFQHPTTAIRFDLVGSTGIQLSTNLIHPGAGIANDSNPPSTFEETDSIHDDPLFFAAGSSPSPYFHLTAASPAVDRAVPILDLAGVDYDGAPVPQGTAPDIGPFEYGAQGPTAGSGPGGQGGAGGAGAAEGGAGATTAIASAGDDGGCGCVLAAPRPSARAALGLLLLGLFVGRRRRGATIRRRRDVDQSSSAPTSRGSLRGSPSMSSSQIPAATLTP